MLWKYHIRRGAAIVNPWGKMQQWCYSAMRGQCHSLCHLQNVGFRLSKYVYLYAKKKINDPALLERRLREDFARGCKNGGK